MTTEVKVINGKKFYAEPLTVEELCEHESSCDGAPSVYVGTYGKYNGGSIDGIWVDISTFSDQDDFLEFCRRLHADEYDPEFMYQDFECFPEMFYHEASINIEKVNEWYELDDDDKIKVEEYWEEVSKSEDDLQNIIDKCIYFGDDKSDFYQQLAYDSYPEFFSLYETSAARYFDWNAWERDCKMDYTETKHCIFQ